MNFQENQEKKKSEKQFKQINFQIINEMINNQSIQTFTYKFLQLIQTIQMLFYIIHPYMDFWYKNQAFELFQSIIRYFQFFGILIDSNNYALKISLLYISFFIILLFSGIYLFLIYQYKYQQEDQQLNLNFLFKLMSDYSMLLLNLFDIPFITIFMAIIYCDSNSRLHQGMQCYTIYYNIHVAVACLALLLFLYQIIYFNILMIDKNIFSKNPYATFNQKINYLKQLLKLVLPVIFIFDYEGKSTKVLMFVMILSYMMILGFRFLNNPLFNRDVFYFIVNCELFLLFISLVGMVMAYLDSTKDSTSIIYIILVLPLLLYMFRKKYESRKDQLLSKQIKNIKNTLELEKYFQYLIELIENRDILKNKVMIEGIIKSHADNCQKADICNCQKLASQFQSLGDGQDTIQFYTFVKSLLIDVIQQNAKHLNFHFIYAQLSNERLSNRIKSVQEIMMIESNKPNLQDQMCCFRYKYQIQLGLIDNDIQFNEQNNFDILNTVKFENIFMEFLFNVENSVQKHNIFWRELIEFNPNISSMQKLAIQINEVKELINYQFNKLNQIDSSHIRLLEIYGNYLKDVINDDNDYIKILEKVDQLSKYAVNSDNNRLQQLQDMNNNSIGKNMGLITLSLNQNQYGIITNTNRQIFKLLGYTKSQLLGSSIKSIMPLCYSERHDGFLLSYIENQATQNSTKMVERLITPFNNRGYIIPCNLFTKALPNLDNGIQIVGFINEIQDKELEKSDFKFGQASSVYYILYNSINGVLLGMSENVYGNFGIPNTLCYGQGQVSSEFTIDVICADLMNSAKIDEMDSMQGMLTELDTTNIKQNFLLGYADDVSDDANKSEIGATNINTINLKNNNRYKRTKILIFRCQEQQYSKEMSVRLVKFVEIVDIDENQQKDNYENNSANESDKKSDHNTHNSKQSDKSKQKNSQDENSINESDDQADYQRKGDQHTISLNSVSEEFRQLRYLKNFLTENKKTRKTAMINIIMVLVCLLLIALESTDLTVKNNHIQIMNQATKAIDIVQKRQQILVQINYLTKWNIFLANNYWEPKNSISNYQMETKAKADKKVRDDINILINELTNNQYNCIKERFNIIDLNGKLNDQKIVTYMMLIDGQIREENQLSIDDSIQQTLTQSSIMTQTTLSLKVTNNEFSTQQQSVFYVQKNGLESLRIKTDQVSQEFINFYIEYFDNFDLDIILILSFQIVIIVLTFIIIFPTYILIEKNNIRSLSTYGLINIKDIRQLITQNEVFEDKYLQEIHHKKKENGQNEQQDANKKNNQNIDQNNPEYEGDNGQNENEIKNQNIYEINNEKSVDEKNKVDQQDGQSRYQDNNTKKNSDPVERKNGNISPQDKKLLDSNIDQNAKESLITQNKENINLMQQEENNQQEMMQQEDQEKRQNKFLNYKMKGKQAQFIYFIVIFAFYVSYYVYSFQENLENNVQRKSLLKQLFRLNQRSIFLRYQGILLYEIIGQEKFYSIKNDDDVRKVYRSKQLDNQFNINTWQRDNVLSSSFQNYLLKARSLETKNICDTFFVNKQTQLDQCKTIANQIVAQGFETSLYSYIDFIQSKIISFKQNRNQSVVNMINDKQSDDIRNLYTFLSIVSDQLVNDFYRSLEDENKQRWQYEILKFIFFLIAQFLVFCIFWIPFYKQINYQVQQTKGMLNIIPLELVFNNQELKNFYLKGELTNAFK